jgi:large subunit ribosomal protein L25
MSDKKLKSEVREEKGRKLKALRKSGVLPANVYGKGVASVSLKVNLKEFQTLFKEVGETGIIQLEVGKEVKPVLVSNIQIHAKTDDLLHVDFRQVNLKEKIEASVPVTLVGESPAEKQSLGTVVLQLNEINVEALPADFPEKFEVNIEGLTDVDQAIYVKDLKIGKEVEIKTDLESIVAKVEPPQKEEVIEPVAPVEGEVVPGAEPTDTEAKSSEDSSGQAS